MSTSMNRRVYHFTPLENLPQIVEYGLLSPSEQQRLGISRKPLLWRNAQAHRAGTEVPAGPGGGALDYVPLYLSRRNQMLLALISNKVIDEDHMIYLEFSLSIIHRYPFVFADRPILPGGSPQYFDQIDHLDDLDWAVFERGAGNHRFSLHKPELAELLIHRQLPLHELLRVVVWDEQRSHQVQRAFLAAGCEPPPVEIDLDYYYLDPESSDPQPLISGPEHIRKRLAESLKEIERRRAVRKNFTYPDLSSLHDALESNLHALQETGELVGLETDNLAHFEDVGMHTQRVVDELKQTPEYQLLSAHDRLLANVAAYLHDIGKGPKKRWAATGSKQQIDMDHPVKALPMLVRILSEEVERISEAEIDRLCRVIVYHDLIGGMMVSNRRPAELFSAVKDRRELNIFFALSRADAKAINPAWEHPEDRKKLYESVLSQGPEAWRSV